MTSIPYIPAYEEPENYLNARFDIKSWLLTVDHKRIAVLYMISITFFFFIGGVAAMLMRLRTADARRRSGAGRNLQQAVHRCTA